jgi:hypothetical protein
MPRPGVNFRARLEVAQLEDRVVPTGQVVDVDVIPFAEATEGGASGTIRISRDGDTFGDLTVTYTVGGTATPGSDYTALSGTAVIPDGEAYVDVAIVPINDTTAEPTETITLAINPAAGTPSATRPPRPSTSGIMRPRSCRSRT